MIPSSPALTSAVLISRGSIQAVLFFLVFSLFQSHQSKFLAHHAVLTMGISTEAIIAIIALFIAIPPIIFKVQQWIHQKQQITELPGSEFYYTASSAELFKRQLLYFLLGSVDSSYASASGFRPTTMETGPQRPQRAIRTYTPQRRPERKGMVLNHARDIRPQIYEGDFGSLEVYSLAYLHKICRLVKPNA